MSGRRKKKGVLVYWVVVVVIILTMLCLPLAVQAETIQGGASLNVSFVQTFNHVDFTVTWATDEPVETAIWHFQFGDGTETVLSGVSGSASFSHDYAYSVGSLTTHHPSFNLPSGIGGSGYWVDPWNGVIVIDDRPKEITYTVYLPIVSKAVPVASCSILVSQQDVNHVVFDVSWENAGSGIHQIQFGDGSYTEQFSGPDGSGATWHDYAYPGGNFIVTMELSGGGSCFVQVNVDWP